VVFLFKSEIAMLKKILQKSITTYKARADKNAVYKQIKRGGGLMMVDARFDPRTVAALSAECKANGRENDLLVVSPVSYSHSRTYNPILFGAPEEIASWIVRLVPTVGSFGGSDHYKLVAHEAICVIIGACQRANIAYNFFDLARYVADPIAIMNLEDALESIAPDSNECKNLRILLNRYKVPESDARNPLAGQLDMNHMRESLGGIAARMYQMGTGTYGEVLNSYTPQVNLEAAIAAGKILYFAPGSWAFDHLCDGFLHLLFHDFVSSLAKSESNKSASPFLLVTNKWHADNFFPSRLREVASIHRTVILQSEDLASFFKSDISTTNAQDQPPVNSSKSVGVFAMSSQQDIKKIPEGFAEVVLANTATRIFLKGMQHE
jgi:hypothetical protein